MQWRIGLSHRATHVFVVNALTSLSSAHIALDAVNDAVSKGCSKSDEGVHFYYDTLSTHATALGIAARSSVATVDARMSFVWHMRVPHAFVSSRFQRTRLVFRHPCGTSTVGLTSTARLHASCLCTLHIAQRELKMAPNVDGAADGALQLHHCRLRYIRNCNCCAFMHCMQGQRCSAEAANKHTPFKHAAHNLLRCVQVQAASFKSTPTGSTHRDAEARAAHSRRLCR